jgi:hypothetical protein
MADMTITKLKRLSMGNRRATIGVAQIIGATNTGEINTGLRSVEWIGLTSRGTTTGSGDCTVNETLPVAGSAVTVIWGANTTYVEFFAIGY